MENHRHTWNLVSEFGELFSACYGCNAAVKKRLRITGWDHIHSKDHRKRNRINKNFNVRIQIWIFQRTKNGYLTVIRTVRIVTHLEIDLSTVLESLGQGALVHVPYCTIWGRFFYFITFVSCFALFFSLTSNRWGMFAKDAPIVRSSPGPIQRRSQI